MSKRILTTLCSFLSIPMIAYASPAAVYSPYKDTSISLNWNTDVISTTINGESFPIPLLGDDKIPSPLQSGNKTVTLAFATGQCGVESWGGINGDVLAQKNLPLFQQKKIAYIIATGGAAGSFQCNSANDMKAFLQRYQYQSPYFGGLDFDIEGGYNQDQLDQLMQATADVQKETPFHVSLTLATLAQPGSTLNVLGQEAIKAANKTSLNYNVNLMVMDFGDYGCQKGHQGQCDMAKSAEFAASEISRQYGIPLDRIELTPMIGNNDTLGEITTIADIEQITQFVKTNHLAGLHYWSFDRDRPCPQPSATSYASPTCNSQSTEAEAFNKAILAQLGS